MPGAIFMHEYPSYQTATQGAQPVQTGAGAVDANHTSFIVWLILLGIVIPVAIIGGLKVGGYSFVFRSR